ncbi:tyrosine-type recombinase/integrase [Herbaspirillum rubrisubalbicans]|uniref:tyrosine-type recombinase/integrase n=1 Tax=Herbaspirillum rubrisubalbicans TaxID=80842 RepID=UPI001ED9C038|nr:tyrosine-type recombinase/integrase [Herbaspirillum rubrisubalbicans]
MRRRLPRALTLLILAGVRTSEALHAKVDEFDLQRRVWTVPPDRMKMEKELRVPLSDAALAVVREVLQAAEMAICSPGRRRGSRSRIWQCLTFWQGWATLRLQFTGSDRHSAIG